MHSVGLSMIERFSQHTGGLTTHRLAMGAPMLSLRTLSSLLASRNPSLRTCQHWSYTPSPRSGTLILLQHGTRLSMPTYRLCSLGCTPHLLRTCAKTELHLAPACNSIRPPLRGRWPHHLHPCPTRLYPFPKRGWTTCGAVRHSWLATALKSVFGARPGQESERSSAS